MINYHDEKYIFDICEMETVKIFTYFDKGTNVQEKINGLRIFILKNYDINSAFLENLHASQSSAPP